MKSGRVFVFTLALVTGVPAACFADWTFAAYVGNAWTAFGEMTVERAGSPTARLAATYSSKSWEAPLYWGARGGRTIAPDGRWSVELELIHLKVYARPNSIVQRFQLSHGLNFILINLAFVQRINGRLAIAARGGVGPTRPHVEATIGGVSRDEYAWGRIGMQAAVGVTVALTRHVFALGEVKQTFTRQRLAVGSANTNASFRTTHVVGGIGVRLRD